MADKYQILPENEDTIGVEDEDSAGNLLNTSNSSVNIVDKLTKMANM